MENEVMLRVEGLQGKDCIDQVTAKIAMLPGVELVQVSPKNGTISVTGGDLDQLEITDMVEELGYGVLH